MSVTSAVTTTGVADAASNASSYHSNMKESAKKESTYWPGGTQVEKVDPGSAVPAPSS